jgi:HEAT repeat protein
MRFGAAEAETVKNSPNPLDIVPNACYTRAYRIGPKEGEEMETTEELFKAMAAPEWWLRYFAAIHDHASEQVLMAAIADPDWRVRLGATTNPRATKRVRKIALKDEDPWVRLAAKRRR